jgi:hypothetical protein
MFEVGDEVYCVDATIKPEMMMAVIEYFPNWVKDGAKYTVRGFTDDHGIVTGVWLEEITNPEIHINLIGKTQEPAFGLFRFAKAEKNRASSRKEIIKEEQYARI